MWTPSSNNGNIWYLWRSVHCMLFTVTPTPSPLSGLLPPSLPSPLHAFCSACYQLCLPSITADAVIQVCNQTLQDTPPPLPSPRHCVTATLQMISAVSLLAITPLWMLKNFIPFQSLAKWDGMCIRQKRWQLHIAGTTENWYVIFVWYLCSVPTFL